MYIRSSPGEMTPGDLHCPPSYPQCDPSLSAGPALLDTGAVPAVPVINSANETAAAPVPQAALAADIQHIGRRNFVGIIVIAVLVFVGLLLWLSFGEWPRRRVHAVRAWLASRGGSKLAKSGSGTSVRGEGPDPGLDLDADSAARRERGRDESGAEDEKREDGRGRAASDAPCSPRSVEIDVDSLDKDPVETRKTAGLRVHFA